MFKKSHLALGLFGAAMASQAADVQIYGVVDAGVDYAKSTLKMNSASLSKGTAKTSEHSTKLSSGKHSANRFGIKGTEMIDSNLGLRNI